MCNCNFKDKKQCSKLVNNKINDGTKLKFNAFGRYTIAWLEKIINYDKRHGNVLKNVNFIDCMASSGLYYDNNQKEFYEGTAIRVMRIFARSAIKNPSIHFSIYLNDLDKQFVKCLQCVKNNVILNAPANLSIFIYNEDKNKFINTINSNKILKRFGSKNLIIYDPYDVDFDWKVLNPLLLLNADYLFTHFFPNDSKRNMHTKSQMAIERYERTYEMNIDDLRTKFYLNKSPYERTDFFRNTFHEKLKKYSNKQYFAYAKEVLKDTMYALYKERKTVKQTTNKVIQLKLFDENIEEDRYQHDRQAGVSEYEFHYDDSHIVEMFCGEFKGESLSEKEFKKRLREHPYLPTNILSLVKKAWKYKIENKYIDGENTRIYIFPDRSVYEQN